MWYTQLLTIPRFGASGQTRSCTLNLLSRVYVPLLSSFLFSLVIIPNWDVASNSKLTVSSTALAYKHNVIDSYLRANISQTHTNIDIILVRESFRLMFTVNIDIINCQVKSYTYNVHGEILTFCTPGTTFHHEHILESSSLVWSSFSTICEFPGLVPNLWYPRMKVWVPLLQDKSKWLFWSHNCSLVSIVPISRSLGSLLEYIYRAPPSRAFTSGEKTELYPTLGNKLSL